MIAGGAGVFLGEPRAPGPVDSHFRYLSGLLLGIGLLFWSMVPAIERRTSLFRALTFIVVTGGLARLLAYVERGDPGPMRLALIMELMVTPALCLWQAHVAKAFAAA